jgi:hypothetical protein
MNMTIKPHEQQLIELLRSAKPMDMFEIAINQNGTRWRVSHIRQTKEVLRLDNKAEIDIVQVIQ